MARADASGKREESSKPKPSSTPKSSMASVAAKVGSAAKPAASKPLSRVTPPASSGSSSKNAVSNAGKSGQRASAADIWAEASGSGSSSSIRPLEVAAKQTSVGPVGGVPFVGSALNGMKSVADLANTLSARREPVKITVPGKGAQSGFDKVSDQPLSFGNLLDLLGSPEVSSQYPDQRVPLARYNPDRMAPLEGLNTRRVRTYATGPDGELILDGGPETRIAEGTTYYPPGGDYGYNAQTGEYELRQPGAAYASNPLTAQERQALAMIGGMENPALGGIETAMTEPMPVYSEPSITETAYAGDLFETDGRVMTPDGKIINPGGAAPTRPVDRGIDAATAEPRAWDTVVDNTGKLLSHTALGGIVSTLFPDMWNGMGGAFKGLGTGEINSLENPTGNPSATYWNAREGRWVNEKGESTDRYSLQPNRQPPTPNPPGTPTPTPTPMFPDLNRNGVDDRIEGYTGPAIPAVVWDLPPTRTARFPGMPPYNPGRSDEWSYFTNNHLADGGLVHAYAEGGEVGGAFDPGDPKVQLIEATEDVLEKIKGGAKPDAQDAEILKAFVAQFGDDALKSLNDNVGEGLSMKGAGKGRQIKGPGGPKDDAVPAVIVEEGSVVSPAKLSNGEFVFSVDAVKGIGEGDIEVGAERLQQLAERLTQKGAA